VLNLLADLKARGLAILFITHDLSLGYYLSDRAVILYRGAVVEMGSTEKVYNHPLHPYTQMLMASVPRLDKKWEAAKAPLQAKTKELVGGCVYYPRCPIAGTALGCDQCAPTLIEVEPNHAVACFQVGPAMKGEGRHP
jgi:peptide/nickel transport system ATP-binding protein